jgi:acetone carboxylase gamma subunit
MYYNRETNEYQEERPKLTKPTIDDLIWAINTYHAYRNAHGSYADRERAEEIINRNYDYLNNVTYLEYNQENFKKLIEAIEFNGQRSFNMTTFLASVSDDVRQNFSYTHEIARSNLRNEIFSPTSDNLFVQETSDFNCSTVGCIAGFATAVALNWKQPKWIEGDSREYSEDFEAIACHFLNIPIGLGKAIFYGDEDTIWAFGKAYGDFLGNAYENIEPEYGHDEPNEDDWDTCSIDLNTIHYKDAINALHDIAEGKILWNNQARTLEVNKFIVRQTNAI